MSWLNKTKSHHNGGYELALSSQTLLAKMDRSLTTYFTQEEQIHIIESYEIYKKSLLQKATFCNFSASPTECKKDPLAKIPFVEFV